MIRAAVLGSPIAHSLSPLLHNTAYEFLELPAEYSAVEVASGQLAQFIAARDDTWTGFSLTMPLKEEILEVADAVDAVALQIQSANTLVRSVAGWQALTTDVEGFHEALKFHNVENFDSVTIIGSGATARAAAYACDRSGMSMHVVHRSVHRESSMRNAAPRSEIQFHNWLSQLPKTELIINTTPASVADQFASQMQEGVHGTYFESLYNPWPTKLSAKWGEAGGKVIDGLDLLLFQGVAQMRIFAGCDVRSQELYPLLRRVGLASLNS